MQQDITENHRRDDQGRPAGGITTAVGLDIVWQDGPLAVDGERRDPNGCFVETVLAAAKGRLEFYQDSPFACSYNADAIESIEMALASLHARTADREKRGVEGTHEQ